MRKLGEILVEKGVLSLEGLRSALEACRRQGGSLGTWLMRLGLVGETKLLEALAEQTGRPWVTALELASAPKEIRSLIPLPYARRHKVVPFARSGSNLDVAMMNPNDLVMLDELASMTGMVVRPYVSTEAAISAALALPSVAQAPPPPGPPRARGRQWRQFWQMEASGPDLFKALDAEAWQAPDTQAATFPGLAPLNARDMWLSKPSHTLGELLAGCSHRDQVAQVLLATFSGEDLRVALFSLHHGKIMGWAGRGLDLVEEDFHTFILPLDRPSVFLNLAKGLDLHIGPLVGGESDEAILEALGSPTPSAAVVVPIRVRRKTIAFLWVDRGEKGIAELPIASIQEAARLAGLALEMLVIKQKLRASQPLTSEAQGL